MLYEVITDLGQVAVDHGAAVDGGHVADDVAHPGLKIHLDLGETGNKGRWRGVPAESPFGDA